MKIEAAGEVASVEDSEFCDIGYEWDCDYRSGGYELKEAVCTGSRKK